MSSNETKRLKVETRNQVKNKIRITNKRSVDMEEIFLLHDEVGVQKVVVWNRQYNPRLAILPRHLLILLHLACFAIWEPFTESFEFLIIRINPPLNETPVLISGN